MAEQLGGNTVLVEFDQGIAWVTLNRPEKRNAMSPALNKEMTEVLEALDGNFARYVSNVDAAPEMALLTPRLA